MRHNPKPCKISAKENRSKLLLIVSPYGPLIPTLEYAPIPDSNKCPYVSKADVSPGLSGRGRTEELDFPGLVRCGAAAFIGPFWGLVLWSVFFFSTRWVQGLGYFVVGLFRV